MYEQSVRKYIEGIKQIDSIKGCEGEFPEQAGRIEGLKLEDMGQDNCATSEGLGLTVAVQLYHVCLWVYWSENTFSIQRKDLILKPQLKWVCHCCCQSRRKSLMDCLNICHQPDPAVIVVVLSLDWLNLLSTWYHRENVGLTVTTTDFFQWSQSNLSVGGSWVHIQIKLTSCLSNYEDKVECKYHKNRAGTHWTQNVDHEQR